MIMNLDYGLWEKWYKGIGWRLESPHCPDNRMCILHRSQGKTWRTAVWVLEDYSVIPSEQEMVGRLWGTTSGHLTLSCENERLIQCPRCPFFQTTLESLRSQTKQPDTQIWRLHVFLCGSDAYSKKVPSLHSIFILWVPNHPSHAFCRMIEWAKHIFSSFAESCLLKFSFFLVYSMKVSEIFLTSNVWKVVTLMRRTIWNTNI